MGTRRLPVVVILAVSLVFFSHPAFARSPKAVENTPVYYLSLGTSLAAGVQADPATGQSIVTDVSYPGILAEALGEDIKKLRHVNLGCPGETSDSFLDGGKCAYPRGSQLDEALNFLHAHGKFTGLITIDLGANDVLSCVTGTAIDLDCFQTKVAQLSSNLQHVLGSLREAAGPNAPIVGMNYYNPLLVFLLQTDPPPPPDLGSLLLLLQGNLNATLEAIYAAYDVPVADVAGSFLSGSLDDNFGEPIPDSIELLCAWTWMCAFQNIHPNEIGYGVIASAFAAVLPEIPISEPPRRR